MKHSITVHKRRFVNASALALLLVLTGCSGLFNNLLQQEQEAGNVQVQIGPQTNARTILPDGNQFARYRLDFSDGTNGTSVTLENNETSTEIKLKPGNWTIKATGLIQDNDSFLDAVWGTGSIAVESGKSYSVNIILENSITEIPGIFRYSLEFPLLDDHRSIEDSYRTAALVITPDTINMGTVYIDLMEWAYLAEWTSDGYRMNESLELPPGRYTMEITLQSNRGVRIGSQRTVFLQAYRKEVVYIYANMITKTPQYKFTEKDFTADLYFFGSTNLYQYYANTNYLPTVVQVALSNPSLHQQPDLNQFVKIVEGSGIIDGSPRWEVFIDTNEISRYTVTDSTALYFRFIARDGEKEVISPWQRNYITNIQGRPRDGIILNASIYSVNNSSSLIPAGVNIETGIYSTSNLPDLTTNTDFAAGTNVLVTMTLPDEYGLVADSLSYNALATYQTIQIDPSYLPSSAADNPRFYFNMPEHNMSLNAVDFYKLEGAVSVGGNNVCGFQPTHIEAILYDDTWGTQRNIGTSTVTGGNWKFSQLPDFAKYVNSSDSVKFVVTLATEDPRVPWELRTIKREFTRDILELGGSIYEVLPDPAEPLAPPSGVNTINRWDGIEIQWNYYYSNELLGYNIYRNGILLNSSPVSLNYFLDSTAVNDGTWYGYQVSIVNQFGVDGQRSLGEDVKFAQVINAWAWYYNIELLIPEEARFYQFNAEANTQYNIEWQDVNTLSSTQTAEIQVSAYWKPQNNFIDFPESGDDILFMNETTQGGYSSASFNTGSKTDNVILRVTGVNNSTGTFTITYN